MTRPGGPLVTSSDASTCSAAPRPSSVGLLLTAPADGGHHTLEHPFVRREVERISTALGLDSP
ncbi:hypothetical protein [Cellulomonas sp. SLBN-39]|uniref:hypothetical protein n=1 Tax=Cellulomonas sp. SLBN-39 TaxID=2768446 RepID=UPI002105AF92|nr:hypothetical protein [Cellulomonas sp. SLBN-39]